MPVEIDREIFETTLLIGWLEGFSGTERYPLTDHDRACLHRASQLLAQASGHPELIQPGELVFAQWPTVAIENSAREIERLKGIIARTSEILAGFNPDEHEDQWSSAAHSASYAIDQAVIILAEEGGDDGQ